MIIDGQIVFFSENSKGQLLYLLTREGARIYCIQFVNLVSEGQQPNVVGRGMMYQFTLT